jgi:hypothetical protein
VIEDIDGAEADQHGRGLRFLTRVLFLVACILPAAVANDWGKNLDAPLATTPSEGFR